MARSRHFEPVEICVGLLTDLSSRSPETATQDGQGRGMSLIDFLKNPVGESGPVRFDGRSSSDGFEFSI